jgi:phage shock protein PspC (stress-responsive transcriptional regulator)
MTKSTDSRSEGARQIEPIRRPRDDRWLLGVCAGFARHFGAASWLVRLLWALSGIITLGLSAIAYFLLGMLLPEEEEEEEDGV